MRSAPRMADGSVKATALEKRSHGTHVRRNESGSRKAKESPRSRSSLPVGMIGAEAEVV